MKVGIQVSSLGQRCGIYTYSSRLNTYINKMNGNTSKMFANKINKKDIDIINVQYEPGLHSIQANFIQFLRTNVDVPIVITAHHIGYLPSIYSLFDGMVVHSEQQVEDLPDTPWDHMVIPHPSLVFPKKDKMKLREKYGLPKDKKILGTAGFIVGTGKELPMIVNQLLPQIKDDELLYLATSMWKGGDWGHKADINNIVKKLGKEKNFRIDTDFVSDEILNEKLQCCDLLFTWNTMNVKGSQSGMAADMYGSRIKTIVKDAPHYSFIGKQDKVLIGRREPDKFVIDTLKALRESDLNDVQDPEWLSWEKQVKNYIEYFEDFL